MKFHSILKVLDLLMTDSIATGGAIFIPVALLPRLQASICIDKPKCFEVSVCFTRVCADYNEGSCLALATTSFTKLVLKRHISSPYIWSATFL